MNDFPFHVADIHGVRYAGKGIVGCPEYGDVVFVGLEIDEDTDVITVLWWNVEGRPRATYFFDMLSQKIAGKTCAEVIAFTPRDFAFEDSWKSEPHVLLLAKNAVHKALNLYFARTGQKNRITKEEREVLCPCSDRSDVDIRASYLKGNHSLAEITKDIGVGLECSLCHERVEQYIEDLHKQFPMSGQALLR